MPETAAHNTKCPNYSSHYENAADRLRSHRGAALVTLDELDDALVTAEAEAEYLACEGH